MPTDTLTEALASLSAGWSPATAIINRAVAMRSHALAGNHRRAEEYAVEIEALQRAYDERRGLRPAAMPEWAVGIRKIDTATWAERLIHGWLVRRDVWVAA